MIRLTFLGNVGVRTEDRTTAESRKNEGKKPLSTTWELIAKVPPEESERSSHLGDGELSGGFCKRRFVLGFGLRWGKFVLGLGSGKFVVGLG